MSAADIVAELYAGVIGAADIIRAWAAAWTDFSHVAPPQTPANLIQWDSVVDKFRCNDWLPRSIVQRHSVTVADL